MERLTLYYNGKPKVYERNNFTIDDNMLASFFLAYEEEYNAKEKKNEKDLKTYNEKYLKLIADLFPSQLTEDDLRKADVRSINELQKVYLSALGGKSDDDDEVNEEKK